MSNNVRVGEVARLAHWLQIEFESIIILSQRGRAQRETTRVAISPHKKSIFFHPDLQKIKKMENIQEKRIKIENIVDNPSLQSLFTNGKINTLLSIR